MKYFFLLLVLLLSACQQGSTPKDSTAPAIPKGLTLISGNQQITLSWAANTDTDLANYMVYWGLSTDNLNNKQSIPKTNTSWEITGLENDQPYFVALSAVDTNGNESTKTSTSSATPTSVASIVLSSSVTNRTNLNPFILSAEVQNFEVVKVEFYKATELLGSDETAPYEITVVSDTFGSYTDSYIAIAINAGGETISSSALAITTNVPGEIMISPENPIILAGGPVTAFEAYLQADGGSNSISATWSLTGLGSLSVTEGIQTQYTPPAILATETTATITATLPDGRSKSSVITLRPTTPAGNLYYVQARVYWGGTEVVVLENSTSTAFPSAIVTANGLNIPFVGGRFQGPRPPVAPGESVQLEITVPEGVIRASVIMPSVPTLTAPANGSVVSAANPLNVSWEIAENPREFELYYDTDPYESELSTVVRPSGTIRNHSFTGIPANKTLNIGIIAVNRQTELTGPVASGSTLYAVNTNASSSVSVTTTP